MTPAEFTSPVTPGGVATFGNERRNQVYGAHFFNADLTLMKNFRVPTWEDAELQIGAQAFNVLNHPNFDQPVATSRIPVSATSSAPLPRRPAFLARSWAPTLPLARSRFAPSYAFNCTPEHLLAARFSRRAAFFSLARAPPLGTALGLCSRRGSRPY